MMAADERQPTKLKGLAHELTGISVQTHAVSNTNSRAFPYKLMQFQTRTHGHCPLLA
ncbi:hypothetical protein HMPREF1870_02914 [Bacteroidales bacterium KA00344]|nr:hypothetical protein HMPREF1870_02914 [Bacteroidales bacterium KA00344]